MAANDISTFLRVIQKKWYQGNRNIKGRCSTSGSKHLQQNPQSYVRHEGHIYHIAEFLTWQDGGLYIPSTGRQNRFFIAHDKRYAMFAGSCEEDNNSSKLKRKEIHTCAWENTDFIIGQIEHITAIPKEGKTPDPALSDRKISKKDHVRLAVNVFVCNLDRGNDKKLAKKLFLSKKYIILILVSSCRKFL